MKRIIISAVLVTAACSSSVQHDAQVHTVSGKDLAQQACQTLFVPGSGQAKLNDAIANDLQAQATASRRAASLASRAASMDATYHSLAHDLGQFADGMNKLVGNQNADSGGNLVNDLLQSVGVIGKDCTPLVS